MSRAQGSELDPLVNQFQHEAHRPRATEALKSLQKVASIVKPIMRTRNWRVGTLTEFYPPETNLLGLNVNRGAKICLRLRYPGDANQFLPLEEVVDTMLHELCHIVHGPHDEHFHALWNQLRDEHEALVRKGYTGEGFLGRGSRLGGVRIPMNEAKRRARAAAEKRRMLTAGSGQKLGGAPVVRGTDIRSIIAAAAQRRINIEKGCASGTEKGRQLAQNEAIKKEGQDMITTQAMDDDENEIQIMRAYIDLIQEEEREKYGDAYVPPSQTNPAGMHATTVPSSSSNALKAQQASIQADVSKSRVPPASPADTKSVKKEPLGKLVDTTRRPNSPPQQIQEKPKRRPESWTCEICTLVNPIDSLSCEACETARPQKFAIAAQSLQTRFQPQTRTPREQPNALKPRLKSTDAWAKMRDEEMARTQAKPMGWSCRGCGNFVEQEWWTCANCGRMRETS